MRDSTQSMWAVRVSLEGSVSLLEQAFHKKPKKRNLKLGTCDSLGRNFFMLWAIYQTGKVQHEICYRADF